MTGETLQKRTALVAAILFAGGAVLVVAWLVVTTATSAHDKTIYAALQGIEVGARSRALSIPVVVTGGGDAGDVLGVRSTSASFPYCWVSLTKTSAAGHAMALDCEKWATHCKDVQAVLRGRTLPGPVYRHVAEHCAPT